MKKIIFTDNEKADIIKKYTQENFSMEKLSKLYSVSLSTIERLLKAENIKTKTPIKNEIGNKYGKLIVIEFAGIDTSGKALWKCKCECGNETVVKGKYLRNGNTKSCGCLSAIKDLTNKRFGKLTVIEITNKRQNKHVIWRCKCDCGNFKDCNSHSLLSGDVLSCGQCHFKSEGERIIQKILQQNNIEFCREYINPSCKDIRSLPFDFAIFKNGILLYLIEFDGKQHFFTGHGWNTKEKLEITQKHDNIKNKWCKENNIPLIRIPYTHLDNIILEDLIPSSSKFLICLE